jgi:hypothetical protein
MRAVTLCPCEFGINKRCNKVFERQLCHLSTAPADTRVQLPLRDDSAIPTRHVILRRALAPSSRTDSRSIAARSIVECLSPSPPSSPLSPPPAPPAPPDARARSEPWLRLRLVRRSSNERVFASRVSLDRAFTTSHTSLTATFRSLVAAKGVSFDTVAREWRCKWSADNDKASLAAAQKVLDKYLPKMKAKGKVQRTVCGGCLDFKANTSMSVDAFGKWEAEGFAPEAEFLAELKKIPGITNIETQTFTLMSM